MQTHRSAREHWPFARSRCSGTVAVVAWPRDPRVQPVSCPPGGSRFNFVMGFHLNKYYPVEKPFRRLKRRRVPASNVIPRWRGNVARGRGEEDAATPAKETGKPCARVAGVRSVALPSRVLHSLVPLLVVERKEAANNVSKRLARARPVAGKFIRSNAAPTGFWGRA